MSTSTGTGAGAGLVHKDMDVFLIPIGGAQYELYFEPPETDEEVEARPEGVFGGLRRRFAAMLREAERGEPAGGGERAPGLLARAHRRLMRFVSERVIEQRLLWRLRRTHAATVQVPGDLDVAEAERMVRDMLQRDADRHLRLLFAHLFGLILSAPFVVVPGPNVLGYFFIFTVVGHFLALRGARHGLSEVAWTIRQNDTLAELRATLSLASPERRRRVTELAQRLRLERLPVFFERIVVPTA